VCRYSSHMSIYTPLDRCSRVVLWGQKSIFSFLRNLHPDFHSGCTSLRSHQQCVGGSFFFPHPYQNLLFVFWMTVNLTGVRWNSIFFMTKDVEHCFMYSLAICISSENYLFNLFAHLLIGLCVAFLFNFFSSWYILDINHLSTEHFLGCLLIMIIISFDAKNLLNFMLSHLLLLLFLGQLNPTQNIISSYQKNYLFPNLPEFSL
jgi:hypothetical protein